MSYLNDKHPNIVFTFENECNGRLSFLDVDVTNENGRFFTSVYRKPTFTGLTMKFSSFIPINFKRNLICTLTTRAFNICSDYFRLDLELKFLRDMFFKNGFSFAFTDTYIGKTLTKLMAPREKITTVNRAIIYFSIPFVGKKSFSLKNKLSKLLRECYPQVKVHVTFKPGLTIGRLLRFKDSIPLELQASVVYKYVCHCCNAVYIGKTKRQLKVRVFEHLGRSVRTNKVLLNPAYSSIREHSHECDHPILQKNFSVLACRQNEMDLLILESLLLKQDSPSLVNTESSLPLLCF